MEDNLYKKCLSLIEEGINTNILVEIDNQIAVYRNKGISSPEGWYLENKESIARELMEDTAGQKLLAKEIEKRNSKKSKNQIKDLGVFKMKLFKNVDDKLEDIGFIKKKEDEYGAEYERENKEFGYIHKLSLVHKANGEHLILSYEKECNKDRYNNAVGLTVCETKLALKKMKKMKFK